MSTSTPKHKPTSAKPPAPSLEDEEYKAAVEEGKRIAKQLVADLELAENRKMRLGELADGVTKEYGEGRLSRYAKDIGMASCTLDRCRSVFRAWRDAPKQAAPPNFSVAQELQAHPDRFEIIERNPNLTVRDARSKMRQYKKAQLTVPDWLRTNTKRWFQDVIKHAGLVLRDAEVADSSISPELHQIWLEVIEPKLLPILREAGDALLQLTDFIEKVLQEPPPTDDEFAAAAQRAAPVIEAEKRIKQNARHTLDTARRALDAEKANGKADDVEASARKSPQKAAA
jgi:hypothetical protein